MMMKITRSLGILLLVFCTFTFAPAQARQLVGTWKLVSEVVEVQSSGEKTAAMGESPSGYAVFTADGRATFIITADGRKPAKTVEERAALLDTLVAYSGTYTLDKDKWTTKVQVAWNPEWVGTEQTRFYELKGERLVVTTPFRVMPNFRDKGSTRSILTFERSK
ncbi:MAG TPA: lipocalin-like domain-containing protein [Pyrinomonadaceae bacterium]|nr:lipocalin-like domain-containing protein [Pyrinomonadaceae bacterium]